MFASFGTTGLAASAVVSCTFLLAFLFYTGLLRSAMCDFTGLLLLVVVVGVVVVVVVVVVVFCVGSGRVGDARGGDFDRVFWC